MIAATLALAMLALALTGTAGATSASTSGAAARHGQSSLTERAAGSYGAIAFFYGGKVYAAGFGTSQAAARNKAIENCVAKAKLPDLSDYACRPMLWFHDAVGAIAIAGNGHAGTGYGYASSTAAATGYAEKYALQTCQTVSGGTPCKVVSTYATASVSTSGTGGSLAPLIIDSVWNGYDSFARPQNADEVKGTWTVPNLNCATHPIPSGVGIWVGLGGTEDHQILIQGGVFSSCQAFYQRNEIVWQVLPPDRQTIHTKMYVATGDTISAFVTDSSRSYTITVTDVSTRKKFSTKYKVPVGSELPYSAEWIAEDVRLQTKGYDPLADFGTVTFSGCSYGPAGKDVPLTYDSTVSETGTPPKNETLVSPITRGGFNVYYLHS